MLIPHRAEMPMQVFSIMFSFFFSSFLCHFIDDDCKCSKQEDHCKDHEQRKNGCPKRRASRGLRCCKRSCVYTASTNHVYLLFLLRISIKYLRKLEIPLLLYVDRIF